MSQKNMDNKNRWRTSVIAFRMSPEEAEQLDKKIKLYGYRTKQEYIISALLNHGVTAMGNPLMFIQMKKQLQEIIDIFKDEQFYKDESEEILNTVKEILKILKAFEKNNRQGVEI